MKKTSLKTLALLLFLAITSFVYAQPETETLPLAFGTVAMPTNKSANFGDNFGNSTFQFCSFTSPSPYTVVTEASDVPPGGDFYAAVEFEPSAPGTYTDTIYLYYSSTSCPNSNLTLRINATGIYEATNVFNPVYQVTSIIYAPPGNKSQDGYTDTTTEGTTTTIGSSFTFGQTITFTEGFDNCSIACLGTASESFGVSATTSNSTAFQETFTDATAVANASQTTNPDSINHDMDQFLIWLNPQVTVSGVPPTPSSYSVGIQPTANGETPFPDILDITAIVMEANAAGVSTVPATWLNQQYNVATGQYTPGLAAICKNLKTTEYNAGTCTLADQCGCTPTDFAPILEQDALLYYNGASNPISPYPDTANPLLADTSGATICGTIPTPAAGNCRYVPVPSSKGSTVQEVVTLAGPECVGCNNNPNTFQQGENTQTTVTLGGSTQETVSDSIKGGTAIFSMTFANMWQWTQSQSVGTASGSGVMQTVTLNSGTVGCGQDIPIYEDTVYHTFVFQQPGGSQGASCTTATATPTFSPAAGTYTSAQTVTISSATTGAAIYYTVNGTIPTTSSTQYLSPIKVSKTETVKAISFVSGWAASSVGSAKYTIE